MIRTEAVVVASAQEKLRRRDGLTEVYLGLCYGREVLQRTPRRDDAFVAYLSRWSEARRG